MEKNYKNILTALKFYIPIKYWNLNDWETIIKREEEVEENIFEYKCSFYTLYFNEKVEPVEYGDIHIKDNKVYYDNSIKGLPNLAGYRFLGYYNWQDHRHWGL